MAKASLVLPDGTQVSIEGNPEEVAKLLELYGGSASASKGRSGAAPKTKKNRTSKRSRASTSTAASDDDKIDHGAIVHALKECDEYESIEEQILDRTSQVDRALLPLYVAQEYVDEKLSLTSGDVAKITADLGIPLSQANASRTLSGTAARYVSGDKVRKKGRAVRYRLIRRGINYMKSVISGDGDAK